MMAVTAWDLLSQPGKNRSILFGYPRGLNFTSNSGNKVRLANNATNMAKPVNRPKYIVGTKLDKAKMEKPRVMVIEV